MTIVLIFDPFRFACLIEGSKTLVQNNRLSLQERREEKRKRERARGGGGGGGEREREREREGDRESNHRTVCQTEGFIVIEIIILHLDFTWRTFKCGLTHASFQTCSDILVQEFLCFVQIGVLPCYFRPGPCGICELLSKIADKELCWK